MRLPSRTCRAGAPARTPKPVQYEHLKGLNEAQHAAVVHTDGPNLVIAGAGSGKTRVLTVRIAHLLAVKGIDAFRVLALTFTNKAAREMKERIAHVVGRSEAANLWMGTFHSVFARILRTEADKLGYPKDFTIYDTDDSRSLIKTILKEWQLDDKLYKPNQVHGRISIAKNNLIGPLEYLNNAELMAADAAALRPRLGELYKAYAERCFRAGAMDFDDLLFNTNLLFRDHPDAMLKYQQRFQYILVDEYQDTNLAQYNIVRTLAARHENLTVVGDDSQSIYAFRGANIQNILNFRKDYPDHVLFKLEQNYRSTKVIVGAANSVIDKNRDQIRKTVWTDNPEGERILVHRAMSDNEEGTFVAHSIFEMRMQRQVANKEFAILYRTNAQSRSMEEALRKLNIPYRIHGGLSFYQRKEIKDLLAYFRLTCNPNDEEALKRIINYPARGIGQTTVEKLMVAAGERSISVWDLLNAHLGELDVHDGMRKRLAEFVLMVRSFRTMLEDQSAHALGEYIARTTGLLSDLFADKTPEGVSRYENIQELLAGMKAFSDAQEGTDAPRTLSDFLIDVALLTDADNEDPNDTDRVSLMTIHSAKGLEFSYVHIVGLEEELFPNQMSVTTRADLEEERRLFYVALTRARIRATLSYAMSRYKWGQLTAGEPSRFIDEIDPKYLELPTANTRSGPGFSERRSITPPWASRAGAFDRPASEAGARPVPGRERSAPSARPAPSGPPPPAAPPRKSLKRITDGGAPLEATTSLGGPSPDLAEGMTVEHERFGRGKVLKIEGRAPDLKATVFFPSAGQKQLLLRFAKLRVVEG
ncbi:MAG: UvrD-helicase domain-containing protein [Flavobacteriales bacterium]|nr:UvrD-helicase domain-containing protein [Flavobacteriales bacterium]MBK7943686.1 UvrD-helicase domain-containing protein [Flavobacteriales bacterium]